jgi:hypothetical protein
MLVLTFWVSLKIFSLIWNKISHQHISWEDHPFLIAEKLAKEAGHAFILIDTAQWLSKLERSSFDNCIENLTATQHNQWDLAPPSCWCSNSKVWELYGLTSFILKNVQCIISQSCSILSLVIRAHAVDTESIMLCKWHLSIQILYLGTAEHVLIKIWLH